MSIRNTDLGGSDWADNDVCYAADLNDTFDAVYNLLIKNARFWDNSSLRTAYDSFPSAGVPDGSKWSITYGDVTATHRAATIDASGNAGGSANELHLYSEGNNYGGSTTRDETVTISSTAMPSNRSIHAILKISPSFAGSTAKDLKARFGIGNATDGWTDVDFGMAGGQTSGSGSNLYMEVTVVALGSDQYDAYLGGYKFASGVTKTNGCQIQFATLDPSSLLNSMRIDLYVDNVYYSNVAV